MAYPPMKTNQAHLWQVCARQHRVPEVGVLETRVVEVRPKKNRTREPSTLKS